MSSCVSHSSQKVGTKASTPRMHSFFFLGIIFFLIFASFLKLNLKSQTTMDEHRHKIPVTLVFFMAISQVQK
jgi:hypothetical protein